MARSGFDLANDTTVSWSERSLAEQIGSISLTTIQAVIILGILFGNGLVIAAFCCFQKLRITKKNYFLASLAGADILYGFYCIVGIIEALIGVFEGKKWACLVHVSIFALCLAMSVLSLFFVAVDRLIAIAWPFRYTTIVTKRRVITTKLIVGTLCALLSFLPLVGIHKWDEAVVCLPSFVLDEVYLIICISILSVLFFITLGIYVYIFRVARSHLERMVMDSGLQTSSGQNTNLKDMKAAKMLLTVATIFLVCWGTKFCITGTIISYDSHGRKFFMLDMFANSLTLLSSALNPLVYACQCEDFRVAFCKLLQPHRSLDDAGSPGIFQVTLSLQSGIGR